MVKQARQGERGAALVLVLAMLLALGFIGAALIFTAGGDLKVSGQDRRGTQAQFAAEAGVQEALARLAMRPGTDVSVKGRRSLDVDALVGGFEELVGASGVEQALEQVVVKVFVRSQVGGVQVLIDSDRQAIDIENRRCAVRYIAAAESQHLVAMWNRRKPRDIELIYDLIGHMQP